MAALTNDCLIFHFLNSRFCKDGWRKLKDTEANGDEKWVIIESVHKSSVGIFQVCRDCLSQQIVVFSSGV